MKKYTQSALTSVQIFSPRWMGSGKVCFSPQYPYLLPVNFGSYVTTNWLFDPLLLPALNVTLHSSSEGDLSLFISTFLPSAAFSSLPLFILVPLLLLPLHSGGPVSLSLSVFVYKPFHLDIALYVKLSHSEWSFI